jgi:hypothetical protein
MAAARFSRPKHSTTGGVNASSADIFSFLFYTKHKARRLLTAENILKIRTALLPSLLSLFSSFSFVCRENENLCGNFS